MAEPPPIPADRYPGTPLRVEFTYEFEDFAEASRAASAQAQSGGKAPAKLLWNIPRSVFGWVLFIGLAIMLFLLLSQRQQQRPPRRPPPRPVSVVPAAPAARGDWVRNILLPVLPWALLFGVIWIFTYRQMRKQAAGAGGVAGQSSLMAPGTPAPPPRTKSDPESRSPLAWLFLLVPVVGFGITLTWTLRFTGPNGSAAPLDLSAVLFATVPWVVIALVLWIFITRSDNPLRKVWEAQPSLHRPHVVEADERGIVFSDAAGRTEQRWEAFTHVHETAGLFLLYTGRLSAQFIPKRAFAGAADLDAFRELLRVTIAQRPGPAFPVLPAASVAGAMMNQPPTRPE